ncbi:MAG: aminotransferase class I/II-fold pyridoxal phosphate-dependent enzyme [Candidatus Competibacterales bacterium]
MSHSAKPNNFHMSPAEFRRFGHAMVDWIADYQERVEDYPVLSRVEPGEVRAGLPPHPPQDGEAFDAIMADVEEVIMPGITHWQSPNFYAYFQSNASGPSILGDLLSAGLSVQGMLWATSPACTELESHVLDWLVEMLDLPAQFASSGRGGGVIQDSASSATLCALLAARERATQQRSNETGCSGDLVVYTSTQGHSSIEKAAKIAGIGRAQVRLVAVDDEFAMDAEALARQIAADRAAGLTPCFVCATAGTTSSLAFDPLRAIGEICRREGLWLHVDAAWAGTAALCPEFRFFHDGLGLADSYCFNPHKWMFTHFDCDCFYVADRAALINALSILPEYLRNQATEAGEVIDYRDWQIPLGRRFRALKLWFVIRHYGVAGLQYHIRQHMALAKTLAHWIEADPQFELAAPMRLNLVCFRHRQGDDFNQQLLERLNHSGRLYLTHTKLHGRYTLRMSVGQTHTELHHLEGAWQVIQQQTAQLLAEQ